MLLVTSYAFFFCKFVWNCEMKSFIDIFYWKSDVGLVIIGWCCDSVKV